MTLHRVEVDAGRAGHAEVVEPDPAELLAVDGEVGNVDVEVEGAVGRGEMIQPDLA